MLKSFTAMSGCASRGTISLPQEVHIINLRGHEAEGVSNPFPQVELHLKPIQSLLRHQKPLVFVLNSPQQLMWKIKTENLAPGIKHTFHVPRRGKVIATDGVELPEGNITDVQDSYKYLGIPQANGNHEEAARRSATAKYLQRLRQVLKSQLNGKHKIQAINTYALPVIRYPAGIIPWPQEEIQATDIKTRKLLTMHGGFHPMSSVLRLYAK
ncbi:Transforming growth factor beta receptor type 3 [Takifugu flavidus]|uniref:Transforming growth factor beta receptor type 3 n=1 Tax=Takifugu flavidus TaxID=433684 RepID=A0A5C6MQR2_9TELE|nr:Transforming growth factor beta receptor type 3 [Takifugu flavidus]